MIVETFCLFFRVRDSSLTLAVIDITFSLFFGLEVVLGTGVYVTTITFRQNDLWAPISFMLVQGMICVSMIVASNLLLIRRESPKRLTVWMICASLAMVSQAILSILVVGNQYYFSNAKTDANLVGHSLGPGKSFGLHFSYDNKLCLAFQITTDTVIADAEYWVTVGPFLFNWLVFGINGILAVWEIKKLEQMKGHEHQKTSGVSVFGIMFKKRKKGAGTARKFKD